MDPAADEGRWSGEDRRGGEGRTGTPAEPTLHFRVQGELGRLVYSLPMS